MVRAKACVVALFLGGLVGRLVGWLVGWSGVGNFVFSPYLVLVTVRLFVGVGSKRGSKSGAFAWGAQRRVPLRGTLSGEFSI